MEEKSSLSPPEYVSVVQEIGKPCGNIKSATNELEKEEKINGLHLLTLSDEVVLLMLSRHVALDYFQLRGAAGNFK